MSTTTLVNLAKSDGVNLENIIKTCVKTEVNWGLMENDIVFAVAFWSMTECGFQAVSRGESKKPLKERKETDLPQDWKHETRQVYEAQFVLPPYVDCPVKLVAFPAEDILCINVLASKLSPGCINLRSLAIHSSGFVPRPQEDTIWCKFSGLKDFHLLLRNAIIWPIRCAILTDRGVINGSLIGLSEEMKLRIIRNLSVEEILMLSRTCHELNRLCNDQGLWKTIYHKYFPNSCKCSTDFKECDEVADWKENFKELYVLCRRSDNSTQNSGSETMSYQTAPEGPAYGSEIDFDIE